MTQPQLLPRTHPDLSRIQLLCTDVDGVLTDGGLYYGVEGNILTRFHVLDGHGLKAAQSAGIVTCFVTMSDTDQIRRRAADLRVDHCLSGIRDKVAAITALIQKLGIDWSQTAHIADDVNDMGLLQKVAIPVCVPNAVDEVRSLCTYVTRKPGGAGALRELCDALVASRGSNAIAGQT
jgi:3-deoxy-D-manno-octulosonate 8-phosphate phosphatase (KDO 8-P phosphatase)